MLVRIVQTVLTEDRSEEMHVPVALSSPKADDERA